MDPLTIFTILSTLGAGVWSVLQWAEHQKRDRQERRDAMAALYVNTFLAVTEVLQKRLYTILAKGALKFDREEYAESCEMGSRSAIEILYMMGMFFGWANYAYRYGPYTNDRQAIMLLTKISQTFADHSSSPGEAFRFSIPDQTALGWATVRYTGLNIESYPEYQGITLYEFENELKSEESKHFCLYHSKTVQQTILAIDRAKDMDELEGRERLIEIQSLLVDLLDHLESQEGFSVGLDPRRKVKTVEALLPSEKKAPPAPKVLHHINGRIRVDVPGLGRDKAFADRLRDLVSSMNDVKDFRLNPLASCLTIWYESVLPLLDMEHRVLATIERAATVEPTA